MDPYIERIGILKDRMIGIIDKMQCSENEKKLACIDVTETVDLLLDAEEGFWDLDACMDEKHELEKENKSVREKFGKIRDAAEEIIKEIGDDYE